MNASVLQVQQSQLETSRSSQPTSWSCDLCSGTVSKLISRRDRRGKPLETVICTDCGLVSHAHIPTDEELAEYYQTQYRQDYHGETEPSARRVVRAWKNGQRILTQLLPFLKDGDRIFEVGAGIGCTVKNFQLHGFDASGLEPHWGFQQFSRETLRSPVAQGSLDDCSLEPAYDLILLIHVIEHLNSPRRSLSQIHQLLQTGGKLYIECPNLAAPFARSSRLFHDAHIFNFTPSTLATLAESCGFRVERIFGAADDPNLQMLLTKIDKSNLVIDRDDCQQTLSRIENFDSWWAYHARMPYLTTRIAKLASYAMEWLTANRSLRNIVQRCLNFQP